MPMASRKRPWIWYWLHLHGETADGVELAGAPGDDWRQRASAVAKSPDRYAALAAIDVQVEGEGPLRLPRVRREQREADGHVPGRGVVGRRRPRLGPGAEVQARELQPLAGVDDERAARVDVLDDGEDLLREVLGPAHEQPPDGEVVLLLLLVRRQGVGRLLDAVVEEAVDDLGERRLCGDELVGVVDGQDQAGRERRPQLPLGDSAGCSETMASVPRSKLLPMHAASCISRRVSPGSRLILPAIRSTTLSVIAVRGDLGRCPSASARRRVVEARRGPRSWSGGGTGRGRTGCRGSSRAHSRASGHASAGGAAQRVGEELRDVRARAGRA